MLESVTRNMSYPNKGHQNENWYLCPTDEYKVHCERLLKQNERLTFMIKIITLLGKSKTTSTVNHHTTKAIKNTKPQSIPIKQKWTRKKNKTKQENEQNMTPPLPRTPLVQQLRKWNLTINHKDLLPYHLTLLKDLACQWDP